LIKTNLNLGFFEIFQELKSLFKVKLGVKKRQGYQIELICLFLSAQKSPVVNSLAIDPGHSLWVLRQVLLDA
jgi:hypothetical protein